MLEENQVNLDSDFYDLTQNAPGYAFFAGFIRYNAMLSDDDRAQIPPLSHTLFQLRRGLAESPGWLLTQAEEFDPEPMTVDKLRVRAIWSSESIIGAVLGLMASEKWLDRRGDGYHLTATGREMIEARQRFRATAGSYFDGMGDDDLERTATLMRRVVDASLEAEDPPGAWCLRYSRRRAPAENSAPLTRIVQYAGDFNAFRDDAHMAAIRPHNVMGRTWEALAFVDDEQAKNADDLFDQLAYRGYARGDWQRSLDDLVARGWLQEANGTYSTTADGKTVRADAEKRTDTYFYAPWSCLSEEETVELHRRLSTLQEAGAAILSA